MTDRGKTGLKLGVAIGLLWLLAGGAGAAEETLWDRLRRKLEQAASTPGVAATGNTGAVTGATSNVSTGGAGHSSGTVQDYGGTCDIPDDGDPSLPGGYIDALTGQPAVCTDDRAAEDSALARTDGLADEPDESVSYP
jgi:hypothetical protein